MISNFLYLKKMLSRDYIFPSLSSAGEPELNPALTLDRPPAQHGMLETALLLLSQCWQLRGRFLAAGLGGSTAFPFPESRYFPSALSAFPVLAASLRHPGSLRANGSALRSTRGCSAEAAAAALRLHLSLGLSTQPARQHRAGHSPSTHQPALPAAPLQTAFLGQRHSTFWVKRGEFVLRCAGRGVPPTALLALLLPGAEGWCGVKGISRVIRTLR